MFERLAFPDGLVVLYQLQDCRGKNKKASVNPSAFAVRFLLKTADRTTHQFYGSKPTCRLDGRDGRDSSALLVKVDQGVEINVRQTVAVGEAKRRLSLN